MKLMLRSTIILCFLLIFCFGVSAADAPHIVYEYYIYDRRIFPKTEYILLRQDIQIQML